MVKRVKSIFLSDSQIRHHDRLQVGKSKLQLAYEKKVNEKPNGGHLIGTSNSQLRENENIIPEIAIEYNRGQNNPIDV